MIHMKTCRIPPHTHRIYGYAREENPLDPNTRILLMGTALVGTAVAIAAILVAKKASASTARAPASAYNLEASNAGTQFNYVNIGTSVTISLATNPGATYATPTIVQSPMDPPGNVLGPPARSTSTSGISDTFQVLQAGTATVTYAGTMGAPALTFNIAASND